MFIGAIKDSNGIIHTDYSKYLKSKHWKDKKERFNKVYIKNCVVCGKNERLHLHHMTYDRIGNERLDDLCYLCDKCHSYVHSGVEEVPSRAVLDTFKKSYMKSISKPKKTKSQKKEEKKLLKKKQKEAIKLLNQQNKQKLSSKKANTTTKNTTFSRLSQVFGVEFNDKQLDMCNGRYRIFGNGKYQVKCLDKNNRLISVRNIKTKSRSQYKIIGD